ncbi:DNA-directed RNA polymerase, partial [Globisporangium splendens]
MTCTRPDSSRGRYIRHCERNSLLVLPVLDFERSATRYNRGTKSLRFDNYYFSDQRTEAFGDALELLPVEVKNLSMKNVGITGGGSSAILNGISLRHLRDLNLPENHIGSKGTLKIFKSLQDPHVNLKTLDLGNNQLGDQAVKLLIQCLLNRCTLEHLDLRRNQICHAAKATGELLRITTPLTSLNLSWNNIRGKPAQYLAKCMMENLTLTHLDLSDNTLGSNGNADAELGACLATNKSLKYLDVSNNHIHGKSVLIYVHGLQQNTVLETLVVRGNPIGSLGAEAILRAVASGSIAKCQLDIGECNLEIQETSSTSSQQQSAIYTGGNYTLNLAA